MRNQTKSFRKVWVSNNEQRAYSCVNTELPTKHVSSFMLFMYLFIYFPIAYSETANHRWEKYPQIIQALLLVVCVDPQWPRPFWFWDQPVMRRVLWEFHQIQKGWITASSACGGAPTGTLSWIFPLCPFAPLVCPREKLVEWPADPVKLCRVTDMLPPIGYSDSSFLSCLVQEPFASFHIR